jgi:hypothetical protein
MVFPLRNSPDPFDPTADDLRSSRVPCGGHPHVAAAPPPGAAAGNDDLRRLESSVQWLMRQGAMARPETGLSTGQETRRLPRAKLLPAVTGIPPARTAGTSTFRLAPPLPRDRLQLPRRQHRHSLGGALCLLIASLVAGSIAYHISAGRTFSAWGPAQASGFDPSAGSLKSLSQNDK